MTDRLEDDALYAKGLAVLEDHLGPVQALRFLALISRQPFDYQRWRQHHFAGMSLDEILTRAQAISTHSQEKEP
ncbi:MAG: hypothetical protein HY731_07095 [Candidatus Tectomicrobia bacterium]|nr:hypothetical protein [Candidatus Tectomicrobia bacterium]